MQLKLSSDQEIEVEDNSQLKELELKEIRKLLFLKGPYNKIFYDLEG